MRVWMLLFSMALASGCGPETTGVMPELEGAAGKRDALPLAAVEDRPNSAEREITHEVIQTELEYIDIFGHRPPAAIDFSTDWVAYYSAGLQQTGGYQASIDDVAVEGDTLVITTSLEAPTHDCVVDPSPSIPMAVAKITRPTPIPAHYAYRHNDRERACTAGDGN